MVSTTVVSFTGTFISRSMRMEAIQEALDSYATAVTPNDLDYIKAIDIKPYFEGRENV